MIIGLGWSGRGGEGGLDAEEEIRRKKKRRDREYMERGFRRGGKGKGVKPVENSCQSSELHFSLSPIPCPYPAPHSFSPL